MHRHISRALFAAVVATTTSIVSAQTVPNFSFGITILESNNPAGTALGSNTTITTGSLEQVNASGAGNLIPADGQYHTVTINFATAAVTNPALNTANGVIDAAAAGLAALDSIRINNPSGVTKPVSFFFDDLTTSSTLITDFTTFGTNSIPSGTSIVGFREPTFSAAQPFALANNFTSSTATNVQPDGTTDVNQAARVNARFSTPEAFTLPTGSTGWIRLYTGSTSALGPNRPVIDVSNTATFSFRVAIVVNEPVYGFDDSTSGNSDITNDDNWGRGTAGAATNHPDSTTATALFDEPLPTSGPVVPHAVNMNGNIKMQVLQFTTEVPYTFNGTGVMQVVRTSTSHTATISVEAGQHTLNSPLAFTDTAGTSMVWVSPGASLTSNSTFTIAASTSPTLTKRGGGLLSLQDLSYTGGAATAVVNVFGGTVALNAAQTSTLSTVTLGSTALASGGRLDVTAAPGQTKTITTLSVPFASTLGGAGGSSLTATTVNVGVNSSLKLDFAGQAALKSTSVNLNVTTGVVTAKLDLTNDGVFFDYSSAAQVDTVRNNIVLAFNNGDWAGKGITSSLLSAGSSYAIGYRTFLTGETFMGMTATDDTTMGYRYTLKGDFDLSGVVNFDDLLSLAQNYDAAYDPIANPPKLWVEGDSDYNGIVNFDDLLSLAQNYGASALTGEQIAGLGADLAADWALAQSLVPEPTSLMAIGMLGLGMGRRRR